MLLARLVFHEHLGRRASRPRRWSSPAAGCLPAGAVGAVRRGAGRRSWPRPMLVWAARQPRRRARSPIAIRCPSWPGRAPGGRAVRRRRGCRGRVAPVAGRGGGAPGFGAVGYGLSLLCYLRAQALVGAARTASVFAAAPFVGSAVALALGAPWPGVAFGAAAALMLVGVWLHASERHAHRHRHEPMRHEHIHTHDDGHHAHLHDPMPAGRTAMRTSTRPSRTSMSTARICTTGTTDPFEPPPRTPLPNPLPASRGEGTGPVQRREERGAARAAT